MSGIKKSVTKVVVEPKNCRFNMKLPGCFMLSCATPHGTFKLAVMVGKGHYKETAGFFELSSEDRVRGVVHFLFLHPNAKDSDIDLDKNGCGGGHITFHPRDPHHESGLAGLSCAISPKCLKGENDNLLIYQSFSTLDSSYLGGMTSERRNLFWSCFNVILTDWVNQSRSNWHLSESHRDRYKGIGLWEMNA